ncbi:MAG: hypothetical protein D6729_00055 [Deltaproteobacteria bacterium]|nr:MAG: hypothetical protein D6729_00055 [Deltaproteobacteria bacterium]
MRILPPTPIPSAGPARPVAGEAGVERFRRTLEEAATQAAEAPGARPGEAGVEGGPAAVGGAATTGADLAEAAVARVLARQHALEAILDQARSGRTFSPQELLVLQAQVSRASFELEAFGKAVQQTTSAIEQTLNTQV